MGEQKKDFPQVATGGVSALAWLAASTKKVPAAVGAVFGSEAFLRRAVLSELKQIFKQKAADTEDFQPTLFSGTIATWNEVWDEVSTFSMFGTSTRLVFVHEADIFIEKNRVELEHYFQHPASTGILILDLLSCAKNTTLYRLLSEKGMLWECKTPPAQELVQWLLQTAQSKYQMKINRETANLLLELVGSDMGMLDQELARLSLSTDPGEEPKIQQLRQLSPTWRRTAIWKLIDMILSGQTQQAMEYLEQLLEAGEEPIVLLAAMSKKLRQMAVATRYILSWSQAGKRITSWEMDDALQKAGIDSRFVKIARNQLIHLGRQRGQQLLSWLVELDFDLKGDSSLPARLLLERFILRLAVPK
ncbi:MAG: DNA polymerase III subunit delta [Planctomycetia bacterium]|nr:DNA polymerase III subunit delta [Planctomycetia bacterium]